MRKHRVVVAAALLALAGCDDTPPAATPTDPAAAITGGPASGPPAGFAEVVRERLPEIAVDRRDEEIEEIADRACAALADAGDAGAVVASTRSLGTADAEATDRATARELIKLAIDTTCPDQDRRVDEF